MHPSIQSSAHSSIHPSIHLTGQIFFLLSLSPVIFYKNNVSLCPDKSYKLSIMSYSKHKQSNPMKNISNCTQAADDELIVNCVALQAAIDKYNAAAATVKGNLRAAQASKKTTSK
jgi:hypothetical protein